MGPVKSGTVRALAVAFRSAILLSDARRLPFSLRDFPSGACGDASLLLAHFLAEAGLYGAVYVSGLWERYSHAWLELGNLIIDITADQFTADPQAALVLDGLPETPDGVLVTTSRDWHSRFEEARRSVARIDVYDDTTNRLLEKAYREIRSHV